MFIIKFNRYLISYYKANIIAINYELISETKIYGTYVVMLKFTLANE